jgi:NAD(P)-dependent dehydrogenase (short-subunit alcohol dehydrogenase family)
MNNKYELDFKNKIVVVTGGSSGLGRAIKRAFAYKGAIVIVADINKEEDNNDTSEMNDNNLHTHFEFLNVTDEQMVINFVNKVIDKYGKIDILINSAGINIRKPIIETSLDDLKKVLNVNFIGTFLMSKETIKTMIDKKVTGKIVNLASIFGAIAYKNQCSYASSKGAIIQFTKVAAIECAEYGICVNAIAPSYIETPLVKSLIADKGTYDELRSKNPMQKFGQPEDVVGTTLFLSSPMANFITGQTIFVDGGWTIW